jgi:hypothetical protein
MKQTLTHAEGRSPYPRPVPQKNAAQATVPIPLPLRQLLELQHLTGLTSFEADFVHKALAAPNSLNPGQLRVLGAIHSRHRGGSHASS